MTPGGRTKLPGIQKNLKFDCLLRGIPFGKKATQKKQLFRDVFLMKNDEGENCRKVLTSHPIRIAKFH